MQPSENGTEKRYPLCRGRSDPVAQSEERRREPLLIARLAIRAILEPANTMEAA